MKSTQTGVRLITIAAGMLALCPARLSAASYPATILADQPVGYWRLEELPGGATAFDSGPYALDGVYMMDGAMAYPKAGVPGIDTNAINFHLYTDGGVDQRSYIQVPHSPALNPMDGDKKQLPFSVECWARPMSTDGANYRCPIGNFGGWGDASGWFIYQTPEVGGQSSWVWVQKGGGIWLGGGNIAKGRWDHLCAVYNGTNINFYVNGVFRDTVTDTNALANSAQPFCIGARDTGYGFFDGSVDEVAIYTNALTLDQIRMHYLVGSTNFRAGAIPAAVLTGPAPATNYAGRVTVFTCVGDGTPPLAYQWYKGSTAIPGATTDRLEYTPTAADNGALFKVVVTNAYGLDTSATAQITVLTDLLLLASPQAVTRYADSVAAFRVNAGGALPITYQWYKGAAPIAGATDATLWLNQVSPGDDGSTYYAKVTNPYTTTNSDPAALTVTARPIVVPKTGYARFVMLDEPVAYWRLDDMNATDAVGSFDGVLDDYSGAGTFSYSQPGGVPNDPDNALGVTGGARAIIPYALELNPVGPFSAEAWLKPSSLSVDGSDYRTAFASMGNGVGGPIGWNLYQTPNHQWAWFVWGDNWINTGIYAPAGSIVANQWHHVVLTYDGTTFRIYNNGVRAAQGTFGAFVPNSNGATVLGWRTDRDWKPFQGTMDDIAFYNKALTPEQVQGHYAGSVRLTIEKIGSNVVVSWPLGVLQACDTVGGTYLDLPTATSPMTNAVGVTPKFYRVKVTN